MPPTRGDGPGLRGGRPTATAALHSPLGFALRLHRGSVIAHAIALAAVGAMHGPFVGDVEQMLQDIEILHDAMAELGGDSLIDGFIAMIMTVIATVAAVFTVATMLRSRSEENAGRAEVARASWQTRSSWLGSHLTVAVLGATGAATIDDPDLFGKVMGAAAAYIPALWLFAGVTALLIGWLPSLSKAVWLLVAYGGFLGSFGEIQQLDEWTSWFSPFGHTAKLRRCPQRGRSLRVPAPRPALHVILRAA
ncbi:hypothetical protein [Micrococcoides hystricis]|uniref:Uncharacterized protein n=1 Tax=Micrococcoides hystricis TaxID=1572761 RepID=A0ABV6PCV4_9MICC